MNALDRATAAIAQAAPARTTPSSATDQLIRDWAIWFGVVVVILVLALVGLKQARRLTLRGSSDDAKLWDLDKLRALRDSGELSIQEYDTLRRAAVERAMQGKTTAPPPRQPVKDPELPPGAAL